MLYQFHKPNPTNQTSIQLSHLLLLWENVFPSVRCEEMQYYYCPIINIWTYFIDMHIFCCYETLYTVIYCYVYCYNLYIIWYYVLLQGAMRMITYEVEEWPIATNILRMMEIMSIRSTWPWQPVLWAYHHEHAIYTNWMAKMGMKTQSGRPLFLRYV